MWNTKHNCEMKWYRVNEPCDHAPFQSALAAVAPNNALSVNMHKAGNQSVVKAPDGVVSAAIITTHDTPPRALVNAPPWIPDP